MICNMTDAGLLLHWQTTAAQRSGVDDILIHHAGSFSATARRHEVATFDELLRGIAMPDNDRRLRVGEPVRKVRVLSEKHALLDWNRVLGHGPLLLVFFRGFW
jgi:hypothetical protein